KRAMTRLNCARRLTPLSGRRFARRATALMPNATSFLRAENRQERLLWHFDRAQLLHAGLALLLLLEKLLLPCDVATVALGENVLAEGFHCRSGKDLPADSGLHGYGEHLPGDDRHHAVDDPAADLVR